MGFLGLNDSKTNPNATGWSVIRRGTVNAFICGFSALIVLALKGTLEENWGLVVNEAMASSLAILSSNNVLSAYDLVINDFNGFKFKNNNYLDLSDKIYKIFSNKRKLPQYQKNSFKKISQWSFKQNYEGLVKALKSQEIL